MNYWLPQVSTFLLYKGWKLGVTYIRRCFPDAGIYAFQTTPWGQNFDDDRKAFSLCLYVASFKMISSKSDFIHIFNILYMYMASGQGQKTPWGQTFDVNRKPLSLQPFVASFKEISLNSILYTFFSVFPHVYSLRAGEENPLWDKKLMSTEKPCDFAHLLQVSKNILEVRFYT